MIWFWGYIIIGVLSFFRKLLFAPIFRKLLFAPVPDSKLSYIPDKIVRGIMIVIIAAGLTLMWPIGFFYDIIMVSIETRKRRSKRRQTMAELEAENTKLRQKIETLEKEMILIDAGKDFPLKPRSS